MRTSLTDRQLATLSTRADRLAKHAAEHQLHLPCLGVLPLFDEIRAYHGTRSEWVITPASLDPLVRSGGLPVPHEQLRWLEAVEAAGVTFDDIYLAHEVPSGTVFAAEPFRATTAQTLPAGRARPTVEVLDAARAEAAIGTAPPPSAAIHRAQRLGKQAETVLRGLATAARISGTALAALATAPLSLAAGLDPIVLGVVSPDGTTQPGTPAAWFLVAAWTW